MRIPAKLAAVALLAASVAAAQEPRRAAAPVKAYKLDELMKRAAVIVVGRLGEGGRIKVDEVLKGRMPEGGLPVRSAGPLLPKDVPALWILSARSKGGAWLVDHPQCVYDTVYVARVKLARTKPRDIGVNEYLRKDDERLARLLADRKEFGLGQSRPLDARPVSGQLQLAAKPLRSRLRAGTDLSVKFTLKNVGSKPVKVMDSLFKNFLVRVRRLEKGGRAIGLNQKDASVLKGVELGIGEFANETDFITIQPGRTFSRLLHYAPEHFPMLASPGKVEVAAIYRVQPGRWDGLEFSPWRGTLISESFTVDIAEW